ncbi:predicted protein [Nematostella vectensis]|uniref:JmjC domain-containing protein n=1 Tax=Nematostella vectensis TaxID=45351 RepID=A7SGD8_NEMVE|nr:bifunctional peptidase and arginyl-hydroxylase JMJD5 [Nematostella vectensis]EDO37253.1 predicted protein [Nematostella vectensis]|eukprot:XP_001629316.1 predicted protein [Nematostella vectensis]
MYRAVCTLFLACVVLSSTLATDPPGHLQPLGSHRPAEGEVDAVSKPPSPHEFFNNYVIPGKPLLFKGAAKALPAYKLWTDEYLSSKFGDLRMEVEEGKKENRSWGTFNFKLKEFINKYKKEDIYMVESLQKPMREDYMLLHSLACGGFTNVLQDAVMWFSSGGTKSVLHYDSLENINCLFSGNKNFVMIDKKYMNMTHIDRKDGSFSNVDVERVDMQKYPGLGKVPWMNASMEEGDCMYIPWRWVHQVQSFGPRNLAVNIWWARFTQFNQTDCDTSIYKDKDLVPLSAFELKPNEVVRQEFLEKTGRKPLTKEIWLKALREQAEEVYATLADTEILLQNFAEVDADKDGLVTPEEMMSLHSRDLERLLGGTVQEGRDAEDGGGDDEEEATDKKVDPDAFKDEL